MKRIFVTAVIAGSLTACVSHNWTPGPDAHSTFMEQSAQCRMVARSGDREVVAIGSLSYVAGAALGNAIGNAVRGQATYNDCLAAAGWIPTR